MSWRTTVLETLQPLGRALMLPIAVLPIAALLLRLGQPDLLDLGFVAAAGDAIFANLGLLFAAGVAVGLARENHGAAALAGVVCYLVTTEGAKALLVVPPDQVLRGADTAMQALASAAWKSKEIAKLSVPVGIVSGVIAGALYNRYATIRLPSYLGFFAGRRFVPIAAGLAGIGFAILFGIGFPWFEAGVDTLSKWVITAGPVGLFAYGLLNRLLLITGLHHILNNVVWFLLGNYHGATGDLKRFFAGDPNAGSFMSGFFPVMMFGLPAACFAMYRCALPERRASVGGLYLGLALTSFLTGVTEPIEFTFVFIAPILFVVHAVLTGAAMVVMALLGVKLGFGFSAGLFDYVLNYGLATRPLVLLPVGLVYAGLYYVVFSWAIARFDLKIPGRDGSGAAGEPVLSVPADDPNSAYIIALGGSDNIRSVDACTTRLRLGLADPGLADRAALARLGARGVVMLGDHGVQVILGPDADRVAGELRQMLRAPTRLRDAEDLIGHLRRLGAKDVVARGRRLLMRCDECAGILDGDLSRFGVVATTPVEGGVHLILDHLPRGLPDAES